MENKTKISFLNTKNLYNILLWILIFVSVFLLFPLKYGGMFGFYVINGHSMEPTLYAGDIAVIKKSSVDINDVIVYVMDDNSKAFIIHRIIDKNDEGYILSGDNNSWNDPYIVSDNQVLGKMVYSIPKIGNLFFYLSLPLVWISFLLLGFGLHLHTISSKNEV